MTQPNQKMQIEHALSALIDTQFKDIGRAHTLEWMSFQSIPLSSPTGVGDMQNAQYSLHITCEWRFVGPEGIIIGSNDLYFAAGDDPFRDYENFDWSPRGSNRLDEETTKFIKSIANKTLLVLSVAADLIGGFSIRLSEGYSIDVFPADSLGLEYWRFFRTDSDDAHFVVTGEGIEDYSK